MDSRTGKGHDAAGRSTGKVRHFGGRANRWKFEEAFVGEPLSLLESAGYRALNFPALKILGFLKLEHVRHGGAENGRLLAPHRQLRDGGISPRKVKPALAMLEAFGIIRCTSGGKRQGGRPNAATYALTWLPTCDGQKPSAAYQRVTKADVEAFHSDRLGEAALTCRKAGQAPTSERDPGSQVNVAELVNGPFGFTSERGTAHTSEPTIYILGGRPAGEGGAGSGVEPSHGAATRPTGRCADEDTPLSDLPKNIGSQVAALNDGRALDQTARRHIR